jgi:hypothetical protein
MYPHKYPQTGTGENQVSMSPQSGAHAPLAHTAGTAQSASTPELHIEIWPDEWAQYTGTAAELEAEGLIPDGLEWPRAAAETRWEANGFSYWLRRVRPEGHKGPMRSWLEGDCWRVRVRVTGRDYHWCVRRGLERKAEELRAEYHRHTDAGARESSAAFNRFWQTRRDERFQAFKALVPGLVPPKRGRKPKPQTSVAGGQA